jgi:imidazolonepropionase-like amidohydrolase
MKKHLQFLGLFLFSSLGFAQSPSPAMQQKLPMIIQGGTVHIGNGKVIQNAELRIVNGKIEYVGEITTDISKANNVEIIQAKDKHIYPSLILLNAALGLNEVDAVRATIDHSEVGDFNSNVRSIIAYNTDSDLIPVTRSNGILLAQIAPQSGFVCGTSSVVQLDAWNWEDAAYKTDDGVYFNYPSAYNSGGRWEGDAVMQKDEKAKEQLEKIESFLQSAETYAKISNPSPINLKLAAMKGLFDATKRAYIRAEFAKDIIASVQLLRKYNIKQITIVGGTESPFITDFLKANDVSVILNQSFTVPTRMDDNVDAPFAAAEKLQKAGILFSMSYNDEGSVRNLRNLPFAIGMACGFGLGKEEGLAAITLNAAKILGIDKQTGSLEVGKDANIVISTGDILDMRSNNITHAFIQGRIIDLENKHTKLHRKFMNKYKIEKAVERE